MCLPKTLLHQAFIVKSNQNGIELVTRNDAEDGLAEKWSFLLPRPAGLLVVQLVEARDLLKKDKHFGGSGKSDPYAVVSIGERKMSFRYVTYQNQ